MTIVIVEGTDCSGKTYAIEKIGKHFNSGFTLKNNYKPKNKQSSHEIYMQYHKIFSMLNSRYCPEGLIILDRSFPSQAVYSYLRGIDEMNSQSILDLEKKVKKLDIKIIYINTPIEVIESRFAKRGDEHVNLEQIRIIKKRYDFYMKHLFNELPMLVLDTRKEDWLKEVERFLGGI